ncbi:MAG: methyltransferase domain-containing protein [Rhodospirillaceae bacterium]|nr:methyltransferase domain-containing protein [Rhodospirillaceae bacterium]
MNVENITEDTLLGGRVKLRQPKDGYRAAIDPVLLAASVRVQSGQFQSSKRVLDVGCGTGAAMFCLAVRLPSVDVSGLERQPDLAALAQEGIHLNNLGARARVVQGDLLALPDLICGFQFDVVMTNPPFAADGTVSPNASVAGAHHESDADLGQWIKACSGLLKPKGRLVMIHRADRLSEICAALSSAYGDIHIRPIQPKAGQPAKRVIIDAGKDRKTGDTLLPSLILHTADGEFTAAADAVLRNGADLISP